MVQRQSHLKNARMFCILKKNILRVMTILMNMIYSVVKRQTVVSAYFSSRRFPLFAFRVWQ